HVRPAGLHREPGSRHPARHAGGARADLRRDGEGMAALTSRRDRAAAWIERLHRETLGFVTELDGGGTFREDPWRRAGDGGGGLTCVLSEGRTFEKAGVNRSAVHGELPEGLARRLGARPSEAGSRRFFVTGMSVVLHPRSPMVPTVHLNVRYFELLAGNELADAWVGGGADLTPTYPFPEDAAHFHRVLRELCARHHPSFYPRFKQWCDEYFVNRHRQGERRGVGGIFFDNLRAGESGLDLDALLRFADEVGRVLPGPTARSSRGGAIFPSGSGSGGSSSRGAGGTWSSTWCTTAGPSSGSRPAPGRRACS